MRSSPRLRLPALVFALGLLAAGDVARADGPAITFALSTPPSGLDVGCQAPCECPVITYPTYGSFDLVQTGIDPLYTYYRVDRYIASFNNGPGAVAITGSGTYKIGGEVALVQQMTLDLDIQGQPTQHYDSGLVPVGTAFPRIHVSCAVHGFQCFDSVLVVDAKPLSVIDAPPARRPAGLVALLPNPFAARTSIAFSLDRTAAIDLTVLDARGRIVRHLAMRRIEGPGPGQLSWDGRRDDGSAAPPGVYWVSMRWPEGMDRRRIVKLD